MIIVPLIQTILKSSLKHRNYRDWETQSTEAANTGKIQIVDYSNKAIAVIGDTKPIKELLKSLGKKEQRLQLLEYKTKALTEKGYIKEPPTYFITYKINPFVSF